MDTTRLGRGAMIAAASAVALFLIMFIFDWFGIGDTTVVTGVGEVEVEGGGGSAWQVFQFIDIVLLITIIVAIGWAVMRANDSRADLPVAPSALVLGLAALSLLLIIYRIIDPPFDLDRQIGVFLGLLATAGIAYGAYEGMKEEGTSLAAERDRLGNRGGGGTPPPPPPGNQPPPAV